MTTERAMSAVPPATPQEKADHGTAPAFLPEWMQPHWLIVLTVLTGLFLLIGFLGELMDWLSPRAALPFFLLAYLAGSYDVALHALPDLRRGKLDTDLLMLAAALGAALLGEWAEGAFLLFLFNLGHAGEEYALDRARNAMDALGELMPKRARRKEGDLIVEVPVEALRIDDVVVVRPGDRLPVDGQIIAGQSMIDQAAITGESVPVEKGMGDEVFAGTINDDGALDVRVTKLAADNTLSRVMKMVQEAQSEQSPTQRFTERFTRRFVPLVLLATALVATLPPALGWLTFDESFYRAMLLLVGASPCALAIGTPAAVLAGIAQAARNGVLVKGGGHMENLGELKVVALDKTGTLTEGRFALTELVPMHGTSADELLAVAGAVEQQSNHPLALAVTAAANDRQLTLPVATSLENVSGKGVMSEINGVPVRVGSLKLFADDLATLDRELVQAVERLEAAGQTTIVVGHGERLLGVLALSDRPRDGVKATVQRLYALGIEKLVMLTGDNETVAHAVAKAVGIDEVRASLLPEDKLAAIRDLRREHGAIAMTGDGVNDAPALATATIGIAMGGAGTAVALESADVALMGDDLSKLPFAIGLSRFSQRVIRQNLAIALGVIVLLIFSSVFGILNLSWAVTFHEGSTVVVVLNALRLLGYKG